MKKVFFIDGGAGRVVAAIPALLKYNRLNPNAEWNVVIPAWDFLFWSIPELQDRTYGYDTKGLFDNIISKADEIVTPEPYKQPAYFKQEISLAQAFDREINNTTDHSDLNPPILKFSKAETATSTITINDIKSRQKKTKTIVIQPFGRGAKPLEKNKQEQITKVDDEESRSLTSEAYLLLAKKLSTRYNLIFFGEQQFQLVQDTFAEKFNTDLRQWASLIDIADYFVGVDSVGQHMARATNTPGTVIFGSTFPINTSYPDYFQIIEKQGFKKYSPIRLCGFDSVMANRYNEGSIDFTNEEIEDIFKKICADIEKKTK